MMKTPLGDKNRILVVNKRNGSMGCSIKHTHSYDNFYNYIRKHLYKEYNLTNYGMSFTRKNLVSKMRSFFFGDPVVGDFSFEQGNRIVLLGEILDKYNIRESTINDFCLLCEGYLEYRKKNGFYADTHPSIEVYEGHKKS